MNLKLKEIWVGDLDGFEDKAYFEMIFGNEFIIESIKIKKDNNVSQYAFIKVNSHESAKLLIDKYNHKERPLSRKLF